MKTFEQIGRTYIPINPTGKDGLRRNRALKLWRCVGRNRRTGREHADGGGDDGVRKFHNLANRAHLPKVPAASACREYPRGDDNGFVRGGTNGTA